MKTKKIVALMLSLAMVLGVVAACSDKADETTAAPADTAATEADETTAAPDETEATDAPEATEETEESAPEAQTSDFTALPVAEVADEGDQILIYGWNDEFPGLVTTYWGDNYTAELTESNTYQTKLDQVLSSGEDAPDLFVCDADYASKYMKSDNTIAINSIGIDYSELSEMYNYTLQFACDDSNVIKGLAWQACPCGVFYNRDLAATYLGVSEPDEVAPFFATWDAFLETARSVNEQSGGAVKCTSGHSDIYRAILNTRTTGWVVDGQINIDPIMSQYLDMAKTLYDEDLTFQTPMWDAAWTANMENESVLTYWGPMWLAKYSMGLANNPDGTGTNPTAGHWGLVNAPGNFFWGGTWMMASSYCDMKATAADIMRAVAINPASLEAMAANGEFVNSVAIMTSVANDASFTLDWLGGQNPAAVLLASASNIDNSIVGTNDQAINDEFEGTVGSYLSGDIPTAAEAEAAFIAAVEALGIL